MQRARLASSPPTVRSSSSFHSASRCSRSDGSSASASSRISASPSLAISRASAICSLSCLKRRYFVATLASEPCSRATDGQTLAVDLHLRIEELFFQLLEASQHLLQFLAHFEVSRSLEFVVPALAGKKPPEGGTTNASYAATPRLRGQTGCCDGFVLSPLRLGFDRFGRLGFRRFLAALQAGIARPCELVLELLDAAGRVDVFQLARCKTGGRRYRYRPSARAWCCG